MDFKTIRVKGYNCPSKVLLMINDKPVAFANSETKVRQMIHYVTGFNDETDLLDKKIVKVLKPYREKRMEASYNVRTISI